MSGGSWDYLCFKVKDAAQRLKYDKCATRRAFGHHLMLVSEALHDIEWVDSDDKGAGDEIEAINRCISKTQFLGELLKEAKTITDDLNKLIESYTPEEKK